jgi:hypothetical protein
LKKGWCHANFKIQNCKIAPLDPCTASHHAALFVQTASEPWPLQCQVDVMTFLRVL